MNTITKMVVVVYNAATTPIEHREYDYDEFLTFLKKEKELKNYNHKWIFEFALKTYEIFE